MVSWSLEEKITTQSFTPSDHSDKRPTAIIWEQGQRLLWLQTEKDIRIRSGGSQLCDLQSQDRARLVAPRECAVSWLSNRSTDKGLPRAWPQASDRATQTHLTLCLAPFDA